MSRFILIVAGVLSASIVWAQAVVTFERVVIADAAVGLAVATLDPPGEQQIRACEARLETGQVRYVFDAGSTVGSGTGILLEIGDVLPITGHNFAAAMRFAKTGSTTGILFVHCWR